MHFVAVTMKSLTNQVIGECLSSAIVAIELCKYLAHHILKKFSYTNTVLQYIAHSLTMMQKLLRYVDTM